MSYVYLFIFLEKNNILILIHLYNLESPLDPSRYDILTGLFQSAGVDTQKYSSGELYRFFNLELGGHVHNAMHDVDSLVASLFAVKKLNSIN